MMSPDSDSDFEVYTSPFCLTESIEDDTNVQNENSIIDKFVRTVTVDDFRSASMRPERTYWRFARRNDREEIRKRLANGTDPEHLEKGARRKPNLQTRLQNGMNLQICFMNETASDDNESPGSDAEPKSLPSKNKSCHVVSSKQAQSLSCQISNTNKTNHKYTRPSPNKLTLPLKNVYTSNKVSSVADFFARQAELQVEARKALSESKDNARKLMQEERETHPVSPITEIIRTSLHKVGITFPKDRRRLSRQLLTDMNVAQLQVIVNDLHTQIEYLNEKLVRYLMERDELHMTQDSMLVDIEDLTRYLSAKQKNLKQESIQNNNNHSTSIMFNSLKPQMNRIARCYTCYIYKAKLKRLKENR
uniref:Schwannomin-interacting protein 1 n=1 Tax=Cacopsylla melanoneura TaxID=428564 RepID=A0A8D9DMY5_9HEMI